MKIKSTVMLLVTSALVAAPLVSAAQGNGNKGADSQKRAQVERSQRDLDRDRLRTHDRLGVAQHDRDRTQDRTKAPGEANQEQANIYGFDLMNDTERDAYRERIRTAESAEERQRIEAQHRMEMQIRARNRNIELDEAGKPVKEN
jgi:Ni/Co efflux regulator RcnB